MIVAAFSAVAAFWITRYMERVKVSEALRDAKASKFVKACAQIRSETAKYEGLLDKAT